MEGADLFALVEAYAELGEHRTGTDVDRATASWLAEELGRRGAAVERQPFAFERYVAEWEVRLDGEVVESLPLFYEATGRIRGARAADLGALRPVRVGPTGTMVLDGLADAARRARAEGREVGVLALDHPLGLLAAPNRRPEPGGGFPVVLVPAQERARLGEVPAEVDLDARTEAATAENVVARFGVGPVEETVVVTTPISGWFRCAGERGTGIAVALDLAARLAGAAPVLFLGATGHELGTIGADHLERLVDGVPRAVVHVGANAACTSTFDPSAAAPLSARVPARVAGDAAEEAAITEVLAPSGWATLRPDPPSDPAQWVGEAASWAERGCLLVSVIDANPWFHTPQDLPATVTSPEVLAAVTEALTSALEAALRQPS